MVHWRRSESAQRIAQDDREVIITSRYKTITMEEAKRDIWRLRLTEP